MARPNTFLLVDRLVPGGIRAFMAARREQGDSYETIARALETEHQITVTGQTVRMWAVQLAEPETQGAA